MPTFKNQVDKNDKGQVDEGDLIRLIAYIKSLKPGDELPPRVEYALPPAVKDAEKKDEKDKKP